MVSHQQQRECIFLILKTTVAPEVVRFCRSVHLMTRALKAIAMKHTKNLCIAAGKQDLKYTEPFRAFPGPNDQNVLPPTDGTAFAVNDSLADAGFVAAYGFNEDPLKPPTIIEVYKIETVEIVDPGWVFSTKKLETRATRQCVFSCTKVYIYAYDDFRLDREENQRQQQQHVPIVSDTGFFDHPQPLGGESFKEDLDSESESEFGVIEDPRPQRHGTGRQYKSNSNDTVDCIMDELFRKTTERWERRHHKQQQEEKSIKKELEEKPKSE